MGSPGTEVQSEDRNRPAESQTMRSAGTNMKISGEARQGCRPQVRASPEPVTSPNSTCVPRGETANTAALPRTPLLVDPAAENSPRLELKDLQRMCELRSTFTHSPHVLPHVLELARNRIFATTGTTSLPAANKVRSPRGQLLPS
eukprot:3549814-Rhodomonas_salina.3